MKTNKPIIKVSTLFWYSVLAGTGFAKAAMFKDYAYLQKDFFHVQNGFEHSAQFLSTFLFYFAIIFATVMLLKLLIKIAIVLISNVNSKRVLQNKSVLTYYFLDPAFNIFNKIVKGFYSFFFADTINILKRDYKILTTKNSEPENFADAIVLENNKAIAKDDLITFAVIVVLVISFCLFYLIH